jgi:hypothetical protein
VATNLVRDIGIFVCFTWFVLAFIRGVETELSEKSDQVDKHTAEALSKLVRLTVIITAGLVILQELGFSIAGILAMGGIGGIAVCLSIWPDFPENSRSAPRINARTNQVTQTNIPISLTRFVATNIGLSVSS